jgi:hypothetical protein
MTDRQLTLDDAIAANVAPKPKRARKKRSSFVEVMAEVRDELAAEGIRIDAGKMLAEMAADDAAAATPTLEDDGDPDPFKRPLREMRLEQVDDDGSRHTLATYSRTEPSHTWPNLTCYVYASVQRHYGQKPQRFAIEAMCDFPCRRVQWNFVHCHATRDEAAAEAAAFVLEAERLFAAWRPDVETVTPGARQHEAWLAHVEALDAWKKADAEERSAKAAYEALADDASWSERHGVSSRLYAAREEKRRLTEPRADGWEAKKAWLKAHPWQGFTGAM